MSWGGVAYRRDKKVKECRQKNFQSFQHPQFCRLAGTDIGRPISVFPAKIIF